MLEVRERRRPDPGRRAGPLGPSRRGARGHRPPLAGPQRGGGRAHLPGPHRAFHHRDRRPTVPQLPWPTACSWPRPPARPPTTSRPAGRCSSPSLRSLVDHPDRRPPRLRPQRRARRRPVGDGDHSRGVRPRRGGHRRPHPRPGAPGLVDHLPDRARAGPLRHARPTRGSGRCLRNTLAAEREPLSGTCWPSSGSAISA